MREGPKPRDWCHYKERETHTQRGESLVKTEKESGGRQLQAEECQGLLAATSTKFMIDFFPSIGSYPTQKQDPLRALLRCVMNRTTACCFYSC